MATQTRTEKCYGTLMWELAMNELLGCLPEGTLHEYCQEAETAELCECKRCKEAE